MTRFGHCRQPRLDVATPVQLRQARKVRIHLGQEPAELREVGGPAGHGLGGVGADQALEVGDKGRFQPVWDPGHAPDPALAGRPEATRGLQQDAEVVEDHPGVGDACRVGVKVLAGARPRLFHGRLEAGDVVLAELIETPAGLNQQAGGGLRGHVGTRSRGEAERFGGFGKALYVSFKVGPLHLLVEELEAPGDQVVVSRTKMTPCHQEGDEGPHLWRDREAFLESRGGEDPRVGPAPKELPGGTEGIARFPPARFQMGGVGIEQRGRVRAAGNVGERGQRHRKHGGV